MAVGFVIYSKARESIQGQGQKLTAKANAKAKD